MANDMLVKLNMFTLHYPGNFYQTSYTESVKNLMNLFKVIPKISCLLFRSFFKRLWIKYFIHDFHPLFIL